MYKHRQKEIEKLLSPKKFDILFVHADIFKSIRYVKASVSPSELLRNHIVLLENLVSKDGLIFPTFNYQFPKQRSFDSNVCPSEVGHISEYFRTARASWRSFDPVFSVAGSGEQDIKPSLEVNSFDQTSIFSDLTKKKACILFYGAEFRSATIIHHAEYLSGVKYRYQKSFHGVFRFDNVEHPVVWTSHFRPLGQYLDYDWKKITNDLINEGILSMVNQHLLAVSADELVRYWCDKMSRDHLYLLNIESQSWVEPKLEKLGRSFISDDFEN